MNLRILPTALLAAILLFGCGGGGGPAPHPTPVQSSAAMAQVTFHVIWPRAAASGAARPRLLPAAATSYVIQILDSTGDQVGVTTITSPATAGTIADLPVGSLRAVINAFAAASAVPLATATVPLTLQPGSNTAPAITLVSTVDHITVTPPAGTTLTNGALSVSVGTTLPLTATPQDAQNDTVPVPATQLTWASNNTAVATVDSTGAVSGVAPGSAVVTVTYTDGTFQKTAQIIVTVPGSISANTAEVDVMLTDPPPGTQSAVVTLNDGANSLTQDVAWPTSAPTEMVPFTGLPPGGYSVMAKAYSQANAGGSALSPDLPSPAATATATATQKGAATIDLGGGSGYSISLSPSAPSIFDDTAVTGSTVTLTGIVQGPGGISAAISTLTWQSAFPGSSAAAGTTVSSSGLVTAGGTDGTVNITASDPRQPGIVGQAPVTVTAPTSSATGTVD